MTIYKILPVIGIFVTVLFGLWGVYVVIRRRYPGQITLVVDDCIGLFDTIVKNFPELAVLYQEQPISHGLVLFKGTLLNSGKKDITPKMVESKITLGIPDDFNWLAAKIIGSSPNVQASVETETNSLRLSTGLFRCQEYFKFEVLAEVPVPDKDKSIEEKLVNEVKPVHRIADTGKIRKVSLPPEAHTKRKLRKRIMMQCPLILAGIVIFVFHLFFGLPLKLNFQITQQDGSVAEVTAKPFRDDKIHIRSKTHNIDEKVKADDFFSRSDIRPKIVTDTKKNYIIVLMLLIYIALPFVLLCIAIGEQRKWRRLRKKIGLK